MNQTTQQEVTKKQIVMVVGLDGIAHTDHTWVLETTGGMHFSQGETWDDIQERIVCRECGAEQTTAPINAFDISEDEIPF